MSCLAIARDPTEPSERGCHVACALIAACGTAPASRNQGCNAATRSAVAP